MAKKEQPNQDILETYPERKQVTAFPERRYIKLTRFLTIFTIINLAFIIAEAGFYFYMANNKDITLNAKGWVHMYSIDPERKLLLPSEPFQTRVSAMQLMIEKALRQYLEERYAFIWDTDAMTKRWGEKGYVARVSTPEVFNKFSQEVEQNWLPLQQSRLTRDVHIYSLYPLHGDMWSAYIETFDFPLDENLGKNCDCTDNSYECLKCKEKNMIPNGRKRKKILLRVNFVGPKTLENPLGILVYAYYPAYVPVPKNNQPSEKFWDLPPALRPKI